MSTKYHYCSYLQTDDNEINLTAYSENDIGIDAWNSTYGLRKAAKDVSVASTPTQRTDHGHEERRAQAA